MGIEWRAIKEPEGYMISSDGRVYSFKRNRELKLYKRKDGYMSIALGAGKKGAVKRYLVHRLVAIAFVPNPYNYNRINHKDENKSNNDYRNLEWCTDKYNANYGTRNERAKLHHDWAKAALKTAKPVLQFASNGKFIKRYDSCSIAEKETGINKGNIYDCCRGFSSRGKRHKANGYIWKFEMEE